MFMKLLYSLICFKLYFCTACFQLILASLLTSELEVSELRPIKAKEVLPLPPSPLLLTFYKDYLLALTHPSILFLGYLPIS